MEPKNLTGFVYIWWQISTNKYYIGSHLGSLTDGYICSSSLILNLIQENPADWNRQIVLQGQIKYCRQIEREIIAQCIQDQRCYNQAIRSGSEIQFKDIDLHRQQLTAAQRHILDLLGDDYA